MEKILAVLLVVVTLLACKDKSAEERQIAERTTEEAETREKALAKIETARALNEFFGWVAKIDANPANQKFAQEPECEDGLCDNALDVSPTTTYWVRYAPSENGAVRFSSTVGKGEFSCSDLKHQTVRTWRYASARKWLCSTVAPDSLILLEHYRSDPPTTKATIFAKSYLQHDEPFRRVIEQEGK